MKGISYNKIAELLRELPVGESVSARGMYASPIPHETYHAITLIDSLCDLFAENNPAFKKHQFIKACGFEPWDEVVMGVPIKHGEVEVERI